MTGPTVENAGEQLSREELTAWLRACIAEHVQLTPDEIRPDVPFASYGLDSVYAFVVMAQIEERLGVTLDPTVIWDQPTLDGLIGVLTAELDTTG